MIIPLAIGAAIVAAAALAIAVRKVVYQQPDGAEPEQPDLEAPLTPREDGDSSNDRSGEQTSTIGCHDLTDVESATHI
jgi:hypothetical protein